MRLELALACAQGIALPVDARVLENAAARALTGTDRVADGTGIELGLRLVGERESAALNGEYRDMPHATNVLSFVVGAELPGRLVIGDLVICLPVVAREAADQGKTLDAHLSHMVVHGVLHLLGFDHIGDDEADTMEALERRVMAALGYADPYGERA